MKPDPILTEVWRIKDKLSREAIRNPEAHRERLRRLTEAEERSGRVVLRSVEEVRRYVAQQEKEKAAAKRRSGVRG